MQDILANRYPIGRFWADFGCFGPKRPTTHMDRETIHMDCVVIGVNRFAIQANRRTIHMD